MVKCKALVFDLNGVIYNWKAPTTTTIAPKLLKTLLTNKIWFDYESGLLTQHECDVRLGERFNLDPAEIRATFDAAKSSLEPNREMLEMIAEIRKNFKHIKIVALSNISKEDYAYLEQELNTPAVFDQVYISGMEGLRKPHFELYRRVLDRVGVSPESTIFVDDDSENVLSAMTIGIQHAIRHHSAADTKRQLWNLLFDPLDRGMKYLETNARNLVTTSQKGHAYLDNWFQGLIVEAVGRRDIVIFEEPTKTLTWNYFIGKAPIQTTSDTTRSFPNDFDSTSVCSLLHDRTAAQLDEIMDAMLKNTSPDGRLQVYVDPGRPRLSIIAAVSQLCLFAKHDRLAEVQPTLDWTHATLVNRTFVDGDYYYTTGDMFLFFLARLLHHHPAPPNAPPTYRALPALLQTCLTERYRRPGDAAALAMRVVASQWHERDYGADAAVPYADDYARLLTLQETDGGWPAGDILMHPSVKLTLGNRGFTTALALQAVAQHREGAVLVDTPRSSRSSVAAAARGMVVAAAAPARWSWLGGLFKRNSKKSRRKS